MKKVLIVSDNVELVSFIQSLISENNYQNVSFDYCYSSTNKSPDQLIKLGMKEVNLKEQDYIQLIIKKYQLIISAHCKQIFPKKVVNNVRCINIHPGLNPYNRGWYPQVFSIINKLPIGCTIHEMDEEIDHGAIICQQKVEIEASDTSLDVYTKVQESEKKLLTDTLFHLISGEYQVLTSKIEGNYNGINDFKKLCHLDLNSVGSLGEHIDLLRALTHGDLDNAYFFNKNGEQIFVKISLDFQ